MNRRMHLNLEPLEGRSLLSSLAYALTTDQSAYKPGQPIEMTFQETNESQQPVTISDGPSVDGFTVTRDGTTVWRSNAGPNPMFLRLVTLQPGQSFTLTATWDGIPTGGSSPVSGKFVISNQLSPAAATATVTISDSTSPPPSSTGQPPPTSPPHPTPIDPPDTGPAPVSPAPVTVVSPPRLPAVPVPGSLPFAMSVTTNHPTYRTGHPVRMTMTLHNVSHSPVDLTTNSTGDGFTVLDGSTAVWHAARSVTGLGSGKLKPGQSIKLTSVWNGRLDQTGATIAPGTYTIEAVEGSDSASTTFRFIA